MARDSSSEPIFAIEDIQSDILVGLLKNSQKFVFFTIDESDEEPGKISEIPGSPADHHHAGMPGTAGRSGEQKGHGNSRAAADPGLNIALTCAGLAVLGGAVPSAEFIAGMAASRRNWPIRTPRIGISSGRSSRCTGYSWSRAPRRRRSTTRSPSVSPLARGTGGPKCLPRLARCARTRSAATSISATPMVSPSPPCAAGSRRTTADPTTGSEPNQAEPGRDLLWPGEFVFGYPGQHPRADDMAEEGRERSRRPTSPTTERSWCSVD